MGRFVDTVIDRNPSTNHLLFFNYAKPYLKNKNVLDIGCWSGQFEKLSVKTVKSIVGIDPSKSAILYAKDNVPGAKFEIGVAQKLNFPNKKFDTVIFCEVIEHIPKGMEKKAINEIKRVLKPNGILILSTPNKHLVSILMDPAYFLIGHRHYSASFLKELLERNGFVVEKQSKFGGLFFLMVSNLELLYKHIFKTKLNKPEFMRKKIEEEFSNGFAENILIASRL